MNDFMKSGLVAIVGRPSVGKSTLLNALCGEKVAIASPVPQTTRNAIRGIVNRPQGQIVFLDTPGYHISDKKFNSYLKDVVKRSMANADIILHVVDASRPPGPEERAVAAMLEKAKVPVVAAVNKIDAVCPERMGKQGTIPAIGISALKRQNLDVLIQAILDKCPPGEALYPANVYSDQSAAFRIAEIVREKAISRINQELPHALYVEIADMEWEGSDRTEVRAEDFTETNQPRGKLWVRAFITVERPSQIGIVVGHDGEGIRAIRIESLKDLRRIFPWKIRLDLRVKVHHKWRNKDELLKRLVGQSNCI